MSRDKMKMLFVSVSAVAVACLPAAAQQTSQRIASTRDSRSSWVITTPAHRFDPRTGRRLIGDAHRVIDHTIPATNQPGRTSEFSASSIDLSSATGAAAETRGSSLPSFPTYYSLYVNDQVVEPYAGTFSFQGIRLGTDPELTDQPTTVPTYIVPVKIVAPDGRLYDPGSRVPGQTGSTIDMHLNSPMFQKGDLQFAGQDFGKTQLMDAWVRAQSWSYVSSKTSYHLYLGTPKVLPELRLTPSSAQFQAYSLGAGSGLYGSSIGVLDINYLDAAIRAYIAAAQQKGIVTPAGIPIFVTSYNVQASSAGGYHDDIDNQIYTWVGYFVSSVKTAAGYDDSIPTPVRDGVVLEHEFAELIDHPFVESGDNGACSAWGYEVGDPVESGQNDFVLGGPRGSTYAFQDLTFYSYNIGDVPSTGIRGQYTLQGTYTYPCSEM